MQSLLDQENAPVDQIDIATLKQEAQDLFKAVTQNELDTVKQLLPLPSSSASAASSALSINFADSAGFTFLMIAARLGHEEMVDYLLSFGDVDVNARSENGNTALLYACYKSSVKIVRTLLENGANYFAVNSNGDSVLMCAAIGGHAPVFDFIVSVYHDIRHTKSNRPWEQGKALPVGKRVFTVRNEEGLTTLMCAVMSGKEEIVKTIIAEARKELGINCPTAPSASVHFFPSIWPGVLGPSNFQQVPGGMVDPAPGNFLAWVDAQNLMGDTALHIAAQNSNLAMYELLIDLAGADPMRVNRRGKKSFELLEQDTTKKNESNSATVEEITDATSASATASASESSKTSASDHASAFVVKVLKTQEKLRREHLEHSTMDAEKRFAELMEEEERGGGGGGAGGKKKKGKTAAAAGQVGSKQEGEKKGKKAKKKAASAATATTVVPEKSDADVASDPETDGENSGSAQAKARVAAASSSPVVAASTAAASLTPLSVAAAPFVPLAELAAIDAAAGWETVQKPTKKATVAVAGGATTSAVPANVNAVKSKKKVTTTADEPKSSPKRKAKSAASEKAKKSSASEKKPTAGNKKSTLQPLKETSIGAASFGAPASSSDPSAPFLLSSTIPAVPRKAWRPLTAQLQRKATASKESTETEANQERNATSSTAAPVAPPSPSAEHSSATSTLADLQGLLAGLHPHVESTDIQVHHFLGDAWSSLSLSQLSTLEEVYSALGRQIRDHQLALFQHQHLELHSELVRTKSELHRLAKEVQTMNRNVTAAQPATGKPLQP